MHRIPRYEGLGYDCLIVGNHELEDLDTLQERLLEFTGNGEGYQGTSRGLELRHSQCESAADGR